MPKQPTDIPPEEDLITDEQTPFPEPEEEGTPRSGVVPDLVRKAVVAGLGALFMTEEGIRNAMKEMKLPKELIGLVLSQAEKTKGEILRVATDEIRKFFANAALREEFLKLLTGMTLEVRADIRFKPAGEQGEKLESEVHVHEAGIKRKGRR